MWSFMADTLSWKSNSRSFQKIPESFVYFVIKKFILKKAQYKKFARQDRVHITKSSFQQKIDHENLVK